MSQCNVPESSIWLNLGNLESMLTPSSSKDFMSGTNLLHVVLSSVNGYSICEYSLHNHLSCIPTAQVTSLIQLLQKCFGLVAYSIAPDELNLILDLANCKMQKFNVKDTQVIFPLPEQLKIDDIHRITNLYELSGILIYMKLAKERYEHPADGKKLVDF